MPLFYKRGAVFRIQFYPPMDSTPPFVKYAVCLQEGRIVERSNAFVGILLTSQHLDRLTKTDVFISPEESQSANGVKAQCNQIYTFRKEQVLEYAYTLSGTIMTEINFKLLFGIGVEKIEDFDDI